MRGGHAKVGPVGANAKERALKGSRERAHHRRKGKAGTPMIRCDPPPHLTKPEAEHWAYYAPLLQGSQRLTLEARDTLAKYCTALATIQRLKKQMQARAYRDVMIDVVIDGAGNERVTAKANPLLVQLRQWVMLCRGYETDLLLSPAAAVRAPRPDEGTGDSDDDALAAILAAN